MKEIIRIATRNSPLAMVQANIIKDALTQDPGVEDIKIISMSTSGDTVSDQVFKTEGGKGLFLKELEKSLLSKRTDIAVHSFKDVPAVLDKRFMVTSFQKRERVNDIFISNTFESLQDIPPNGKIGTSSPRRISILKSLSNNYKIAEIRGNLQTRLKKLKDLELDGIILASAGFSRMKLKAKYVQHLPVEEFVPAAGQGALCIQFLKERNDIKKILEKYINKDVQVCSEQERNFVKHINGNCMSPIGVYASINKDELIITTMIANFSGTKMLKMKKIYKIDESGLAGVELAKLALKQGAKEILKI